jgi:hypothetical protein
MVVMARAVMARAVPAVVGARQAVRAPYVVAAVPMRPSRVVARVGAPAASRTACRVVGACASLVGARMALLAFERVAAAEIGAQASNHAHTSEATHASRSARGRAGRQRDADPGVGRTIRERCGRAVVSHRGPNCSNREADT